MFFKTLIDSGRIGADSGERSTPDSVGSENLIKMSKGYVSPGLVVNEKECLNNSTINSGGGGGGFANNGMVQNLNNELNKSK